MQNVKNKTALIIIDVQKGFNDPIWGKRNNPKAEENIKTLLNVFRETSNPVIHIQHLSVEPKSPLRPGQNGSEFMEGMEPKLGERVFQKSVNSAFIGTGLEAYLRENQITSLVLAGITSDHCVSTTTRMAANLGFEVTVVADATIAFERKSITGQIFDAELVHQVSLASLSGEFAVIKNTSEFKNS
jgi:nicotinamidase-related amidase